MIQRIGRMAVAAVVAVSVCGTSAAQDEELNRPPILSGQGGAIPVRVVDDRLVVACDVSGPKLRVPVNLWLDFDGPYAFQLHNKAAAPLPAETQDGKPRALTLHFPDFTIEVARRELGPEEAFERFTKYHSKELGENALVGALGAECLKHFDVVFDLPRGQVSILPAGQLADRVIPQSENQIVTPITLQNDLVWIPVNLQSPGGALRRAMAIGSSRYDSLLEKRLCNTLQRPAGNVGSVRCESIDFSPYVAFRPARIVQLHPDGVAGILGINLLQQFRIHIDRRSLLATLQSGRSPAFPEQDLAWFQAMVTEDSQRVLAWLKKYGQTRLGREAAEFLLNLLLDEGAEPDELAQAIQWVNDTMPEDLRATRLFDLMEELVNEGEQALGISAGELGLKSARRDRYPESSYQLHGRLGELLLPSDNREAWRHLLSAAFGLPEDGMINLNLGRCYEANGKKKRAFSRYIQALVKQESSELAMVALARLDAELPVEQRMTIESIDRMISGRVRNYSAPTTYEPDPDTRSNRTSLVEFFTNAYVGDERAGAIGGALGYQGAMSHFADADCVFLSYHLPVPRSEPLVTPLALHMRKWLKVRGPTVQVVDGVRRAPGVGRYRSGERIYESIRDIVAHRLQQPTRLGVMAKGRLEGRRLRGQVVVRGPAVDAKTAVNSGLVVQAVIAERGVVFHGSSGVVIHRMLARGLATEGGLSGIPYVPAANGRFEFAFSRDLDDIVQENKAHLDALEQGQATDQVRMGLRIEPQSVEVVIVVREAESGAVVQVAKCVLDRVEASP